LEVISHEPWNMLFQIRIDEEKEETGVEELSNKYTIGNWGKPLTISILTDPGKQGNGGSLENLVESNDDNRNHNGKLFTIP